MKYYFSTVLVTVLSLSFFAKAENFENNPKAPLSRQSEKVQETKNVSLEISNAWARPTDAGASSRTAIYLKISNKSASSVDIVDFSADEVADKTEMHQTIVDSKGIARMSMLHQLTIPAMTEVVLQPKGLHIMLIGMKKQLNIGDELTLTLKTKDGESVNVSVIVDQRT